MGCRERTGKVLGAKPEFESVAPTFTTTYKVGMIHGGDMYLSSTYWGSERQEIPRAHWPAWSNGCTQGLARESVLEK